MDKTRPVPTLVSPFLRMVPSPAPRCLRWERAGCPELFFWLRPTLATPHGNLMPDGLLYTCLRGRGTWVMVEIDEERHPSLESLERERLAPLPTIRVTPDQLAHCDLVDCLLGHLQRLLDRAA